jgi:hypothetical protein
MKSESDRLLQNRKKHSSQDENNNNNNNNENHTKNDQINFDKQTQIDLEILKFNTFEDNSNLLENFGWLIASILVFYLSDFSNVIFYNHLIYRY